MKITEHGMTFDLTIKEVGVWMEAVRLAALKRSVPMFPWDSCPFLNQHAELVRLTGYGASDHEELRKALQSRAEK